jgi:hypothetical protein
MPYAFNDREIAAELKRFASGRMGTTNHPRTATGNEVILVKAPAAGIVGIDGTTITAGTCTKVYIDMSGADPATAEDDSVEMSVLNTTSDDIAGDSIFQAARLGSLWVSVAGGGGGMTTAMFVSTSTITGNSEGTANIRTYNGTSWTTDTGTAYTIVNPWADDVSTAKNLTAYSHSSGKWIMIQAECEDE